MENKLFEEVNRIQELMYGSIVSEQFRLPSRLKNIGSSTSLQQPIEDLAKIIRGTKTTSGKIAELDRVTSEMNKLIKQTNDDLIKLRSQRRTTTDPTTKKNLSKQIKDTQNSMAEYTTVRDEMVKLRGEYQAYQVGQKAGRVKGSKKGKKKQTTNQTINQTNTTQGGGTNPPPPGNAPVPPPPVPPPPPPNPPQFSKWWQNPKVTKYAKIAAAVAAGGGALVLLYNLLKKEGDTESICIAKNMEKYPNNLKLKDSNNPNVGYYSVTPTNRSILEKYPRFTIEAGTKRKKVYYNGKHIANWSSDNSCNLFITIGGQKFPIFTGAAVAPSPSPRPKPKTEGIKYTQCSGSYKIGCYSEKIMELQKCMGIKIDGYWGRNTDAAVLANFGKKVLTDAEIDARCNRQPTPQPEQPTDTGSESQTVEF